MSGPLRVLMVAARFLPDLGGIETHVHEVARRLVRSGDLEITVLATDRTRGLPRQDTVSGIPVIRVPAWPKTRDYYLAPAVPRIVARPDRWDLVHCQGVHTPIPALAMLAAGRAGIPYVVSFHTGGHSLAHRNAARSVQWRALGPLLRRAELLVGVSRFEAELLTRQARLDPATVRVVRNGGTLPPTGRPVPREPGLIVSSGRLERYKGHHRVIEALPQVLAARPEARLEIVGAGPYEAELRDLADRLGVADRVGIRFLPPDQREEMGRLLSRANVVAALSDYEAHPVAVMEALSLGCPVVGYDVAGIGDLVAEGWVTGVAPGTPATGVAERLLDAMSRPQTRCEDLPTWDSCATALADVYRAAARRTAPVGTGPA